MREHDSGETGRQRMNKKKLPKAVLRTADQMREAAAERSQDAPHPVDLNETPAPRPAVMRTADRAANGNVIEMVPKADAAEAPQSADNGAAALRRRMAVAIVERYANWAAVGGALPVPIANATAVTALMVRMIQSLSKLYGVPFEKNRTRAAVVGLMAGMLPTGLATIAASARHLLRAGLRAPGPCRFVGDLIGLCAPHRPALHRAIRERLDRRSISARSFCGDLRRLSTATAVQFNFLFCAFMRSIRLFGRMSVQF